MIRSGWFFETFLTFVDSLMNSSRMTGIILPVSRKSLLRLSQRTCILCPACRLVKFTFVGGSQMGNSRTSTTVPNIPLIHFLTLYRLQNRKLMRLMIFVPMAVGNDLLGVQREVVATRWRLVWKVISFQDLNWLWVAYRGAYFQYFQQRFDLVGVVPYLK